MSIHRMLQRKPGKAFREICAWCVERVEEFRKGELEDVSFKDDHVEISTIVDEYAMSCHVGAHTETIRIPNEVFFSISDGRSWRDTEGKRQVQAQLQAKYEEQMRQSRERQLREERAQYEYLKKKLEGGENV